MGRLLGRANRLWQWAQRLEPPTSERLTPDEIVRLRDLEVSLLYLQKLGAPSGSSNFPQITASGGLLDKVATCGHIPHMKTVSIRDAKNRLTELAREVEEGETIVVTRNGRPVLDLVPHRKVGGLNLSAGEAYLRSKGIENPVPFIADDFDDPLPEDFLLRPLPFD